MPYKTLSHCLIFYYIPSIIYILLFKNLLGDSSLGYLFGITSFINQNHNAISPPGTFFLLLIKKWHIQNKLKEFIYKI